jgi:hypothetical protein
MTDSKEKRIGLENQGRLLKRKLEALREGNWGLEPVMSGEGAEHPDYRSLEKQIEAVEAELMAIPCSKASLEHRFDCINSVLERPGEALALREIHLHVDAMSVKVDGPDDAASPPMRLTELFSSGGEKRIVLFGYFPRDELPPEKDFFKEAGRLLG